MSNTEYPKMLYSGDKESYSSRIVHTAEEEAQFREIGLTDYADLPEPEPKIKEVAPGEATQGFVTTEQFDALALKVAELGQENAALSKKLRIKELEDTSVDNLKAMLTERNISFGARDSKAVLLNLVVESDGGE